MRRDVEEVDGNGRCNMCSSPVKCENCGRLELGRTWFPDYYGHDEFGMCRKCTIKCANCNKAVQYDDDLDDDQEPQQQ